MPTADYDSMPPDEGQTVPEGEYLCQVVGAEEDRTKGGDEMLKLKFKILEGKSAGRYLFDNMVFSQKAMKRVKFISEKLGLATSGQVEINEELLKGRQVFLNTVHEEFGGETRNKIPWNGYREVPPDDQAVANSGAAEDGGGPAPDDEIPF